VSDHAADITSYVLQATAPLQSKDRRASHNLEGGVEMQPALAELGKDEAAIGVGEDSVGGINPG
jgi:hypothetical protein